VRITHRHPAGNWFAAPESDPVDDDYQAEVDRSTGRAERDYRQAQDRLRRAEARLAKAEAAKATAASRRLAARLRGLVDERRAEVDELARLMATPATADKQVRLRTGRDDHLELGEYKPQQPRRVPAGPVTTTHVRKGNDGQG
jgi:hypothetical protein